MTNEAIFIQAMIIVIMVAIMFWTVIFRMIIGFGYSFMDKDTTSLPTYGSILKYLLLFTITVAGIAFVIST